MKLTYGRATSGDAACIYQLCKQLIDEYETIGNVDYAKVLDWVRKKIENAIEEYTTIYADGQKAGYYHFYKNEEEEFEIDDLYVFPEFQNRGIGSEVISRCCSEVNEPVMLYVFIHNHRAVSLYKRLGFEVVKTIADSRYIMKRKCDSRKYYAAYDERYKTAHAHGVSWSSDVSTPIVMEVIRKYHIGHDQRLLEIGCGEGRDSRRVLEQGYRLMATDISREAIGYCKKTMPQYEHHFRILDCLSDTLNERFDFIFGIAVIHMLVLDEDRNGFYQFIHSHLGTDGIALICTMGDGEMETQSDISQAFCLREREHESGKMMVAGTSCRMVSFRTFENELRRNGFAIIEKGITGSLPNFNSLLYAVVRKQ